jgi:hypothetical protein
LKLRNLFTDAEVLSAYTEHGDDYVAVANTLSTLRDVDVSRQLVRYWCKQFDKTKKNGDYYLTLAGTNRDLKNERTLRDPKPSDQLALAPQSDDSTIVLVFSDTHCPYMHPDYIDFLTYAKREYRPTMILCGGDEVDSHALSFHNSDPALDSAGIELDNARIQLSNLHNLFPDMRIVESNHGSMVYRKAKAHGIPAAYIKSYRDVLFPDGEGKAWSWHDTVRLEMSLGRDIQLQHQGTGDLTKLAAHENANLIVGHEHSKFGIGYAASRVDDYWSLYLGCGIDRSAMAFAYGQHMPSKPVLGCSIIVDGVPQLIPMRLDRHERWIG